LGADPWPNAPELPAPIIMDQRWVDAVFLHWRIPEAVSASFMPLGVVPDVFDGSAWVGLIGLRMRRAGLGRGPGIPYVGSFNEINVRLYSREPDGTRGVVFRTLDASRLAVVLAARAAGIPYVWSRASFGGGHGLHSASSADVSAGAAGAIVGYSVRRFRAAPDATSPSSRSPTSKRTTRCPSTSQPGSVCIPVSRTGPCTSPTRTVRGRCTGRN